MTVSELKIGQSAKILSLEAEDELKQRLYSFGINSGKKLTKINSSLGGKTIAIELDHSCVLLRSSEAEAIKVEIL